MMAAMLMTMLMTMLQRVYKKKQALQYPILPRWW